jgi:murein DD-endopeptidase MepM/ murein hydrolase activator NlpD
MKRTLLEDLERIHSITYGKQTIQEQGLLDNILRKVGLKDDKADKIDDPKKADLVSSDVNDFFLSLQKSVDNGGLNQQQRGGMSYQKEVESMQIGLLLLGYELPNHGVDGLFGPETAAAVSKFTNEKVGDGKAPVNEAVKLVSQGGGIIGRPGQGTHNANDWQSGNAWDVTGPVGTQVFSVTNGTVEKVKKAGSGIVRSGVKVIFGDQVRVKSTDGKPDVFYTHIDASVNAGDSVKEGDVIGTIIQMGGIPSHVHVGLSSGNLSDVASGLSNAGGGSASVQMTKATPEMLKTLIELLKQRGVKSEELKQYIDSVKTGGGAAFTDLDLTTEEGFKAYAEICQKFINIYWCRD